MAYSVPFYLEAGYDPQSNGRAFARRRPRHADVRLRRSLRRDKSGGPTDVRPCHSPSRHPPADRQKSVRIDVGYGAVADLLVNAIGGRVREIRVQETKGMACVKESPA